MRTKLLILVSLVLFAITSQTALAESGLRVEPASITINQAIPIGEQKYLYSLKIQNTGSTAETMKIYPEKPFRVRPEQLVLEPGEQGLVKLEIDATGVVPGDYTGKVLVQVEKGENAIRPAVEIRVGYRIRESTFWEKSATLQG